MTGHEGEKTTTLTGLKRSEVLRQTEDGSFEFIVDEAEEEVGSAPRSMDAEEPEPAVRAIRPWRKRLLLAAPVTAVALIIIGIVLTRDSEEETRPRGSAEVILDDVPGFRPYGGVESTPKARPQRKAPARAIPRPKVEEEFDEEFLDEEFYDEPQDENEDRWAVGQRDEQVVVEDLDSDEEVRTDPESARNRRDVLRRRELPTDISSRVTRPEALRQLQEQNLDGRRLPLNPASRVPPGVRDQVLERGRVDEEYLDNDPVSEEFLEEYIDDDSNYIEPTPQPEYEEEFEDEWEETDDENY
ncbi:MAG: hypothetical protein ACNA8W_17910 [Bradymonadaceae bacterium]